MRRALLFLAVALIGVTAAAWGAPAVARPAEVARVSPSAEEVGRVRYRFLAWTIFDAVLWTESGAFSWDRPFALSLTYAREFSAESLAKRSVAEMEDRGYGEKAALEPLRRELEACFADVARGDRITGVSEGPDRARFYFNGEATCVVERRGFRRAFFGIWLERGDASAPLLGRPDGERI